ncbi:hypothetical protein QBC37DRAFT_83755 [Rhypophila decipiens]|uniref:Cyclin-dependent kinase n=1 Tax=Rhypophila decipiens TaxID=261697 RepID=A0AAN7BAB4_9PEZI|nr:hypothetical protein QBC37DRAFT_83755 [Rhypophila decipiens]
MDTRSPTKRRVLGVLDPNAASPRTPQPVLDGKRANFKSEHVVASTRSPSNSQARSHRLPSPLPRQDSPGLRKRSVHEMAPSRGEEEDPAAPARKRPCLRDDAEEDASGVGESPVSPLRNRSASSETSSVFDNSVNDTSHATAITEPDEQQRGAPANPLSAVAAAAVAASGPSRRAPGSRLTREQTREKAETIRLRLGLAAYKVRTGQTDVPLERLRVLPMVLPGATSFRSTTTNSASTPRHALPPTAHFARSQQQQPSLGGRDYRRALPSGISLSALGSGGERRSNKEDGHHQQQQQQSKGSDESRNDSHLRSSPPALPAARVTEESPESLPTLEHRSTSTSTVEQDDVLPDAANGLLSLARG